MDGSRSGPVVVVGAGILAWRAMPADRLPIVGPVPWLDTLYVAVTHSGLTVAPAWDGWSP